MGGDTPSSHSFYDTLAANCIPILISDRFKDLALPLAHGDASKGPIRGGIPIESFTHIIPENRWMQDLHMVAAELEKLVHSVSHLSWMFENMKVHRNNLLWEAPGSRLNEQVLRAA